MLTPTLILCPADLTSSGKISLGTNQPRGPHDHAKAATYMHMNVTTVIAYHFGKSPGFPFVPNFSAIAIAMTICNNKKQKKGFRVYEKKRDEEEEEG